MRISFGLCVIGFALTSASSALAQNPSTMAPSNAAPPQNQSCSTCGTLESIRYVEQKGKASGGGAVVGGVLGGVVGHQFGSGRGNTVATIAGVGVGAVAGNEVEKNVKKTYYYTLTVRLDNGKRQTVSQSAKPNFREGDRVRIVDGNRLVLVGG
ncbi:MAG: glycine zipper 2TM domain-containing protein [Casimicrobiaceae bacterium]